jgi:hypothetical protein
METTNSNNSLGMRGMVSKRNDKSRTFKTLQLDESRLYAAKFHGLISMGNSSNRKIEQDVCFGDCLTFKALGGVSGNQLSDKIDRKRTNETTVDPVGEVSHAREDGGDAYVTSHDNQSKQDTNNTPHNNHESIKTFEIPEFAQ